MSARKIKQIVTGVKTQDGAGVKLTRVLGSDTAQAFDPFLMLDAFDSQNPDDYVRGFPWHPHRGIETVTYLIRGRMEHGDHLGNKGVITDGSSQWMTAGSGIIHQEMPMPADHLLGVQLWINLPEKDKMATPKYHSIQADMIPKVQEQGARVAVIAGHYKDTAAKFQGEYVKATYLDVALQPDAHWKLDTDPKHTLFVYILEGSLIADLQELQSKRAVLFGEGDTLQLKAGKQGARFLLLSGKPLNESIAWGGPVVMNTREQLAHAFEELDNDTFVKTKAS